MNIAINQGIALSASEQNREASNNENLKPEGNKESHFQQLVTKALSQKTQKEENLKEPKGIEIAAEAITESDSKAMEPEPLKTEVSTLNPSGITEKCDSEPMPEQNQDGTDNEKSGEELTAGLMYTLTGLNSMASMQETVSLLQQGQVVVAQKEEQSNLNLKNETAFTETAPINDFIGIRGNKQMNYSLQQMDTIGGQTDLNLLNEGLEYGIIARKAQQQIAGITKNNNSSEVVEGTAPKNATEADSLINQATSEKENGLAGVVAKAAGTLTQDTKTEAFMPAEKQLMTDAKPYTDEKKGNSQENSLGSINYDNTMQTSVNSVDKVGINPQNLVPEKVEPYSQISQEILTKLEQKGPTEFKMQLEPEELGKIDIKLKISEGQLTIDIIAANSKTQALLSGQVDKLIQSIGLQNVKVENVQVSQQMNQQGHESQSQSQAFSMNSGMDFSQRRQQSELQQQFGGRQNQINVLSSLGSVNELEGAAATSQRLKGNYHRMDYAV